MRTISLKIPVHLEALVAREAKQQRVSKASVVRSCVEEVLLKRPQAEQPLTCADLAGDLIGSLDGPADLSTNKRYLEPGFPPARE